MAACGPGLGEGQSGGDADLLGDEVDARDLLGDGVLDLEAGVDFEGVDARVLGDEEFAGPEAGVVDGLEEGAGVGFEGALDGGRQVRGGCFLDDLLVAALDRAVAGRDDCEAAVGVAGALGLDVPGPRHHLLDEAAVQGRGAEEGLEVAEDVALGVEARDPAPAAGVGALDEDGVAGAAREVEEAVSSGVGPGGQGRSGDDGDAGLRRDRAGGDLVAEGADRVRARADPHEPGLADRGGEIGVLGEEAVSGGIASAPDFFAAARIASIER